MKIPSILAALLVAFSVFGLSVRAQDWTSVADKIRPSLGHLVMHDKDGVYAGNCTALSINDEKDYFLSANHCKADQMTLDGKPATSIYSNDVADLMVVVVPRSGSYPALKLATSVGVGEEVGAYGWGFGLAVPTFKAGHVAVPSVKIPELFTEMGYGSVEDTYTILDFNVIHGMSGGPVFDGNGDLVSIVQVESPLPDSVGIGRSVGEITAKVGKYFLPDK